MLWNSTSSIQHLGHSVLAPYLAKTIYWLAKIFGAHEIGVFLAFLAVSTFFSAISVVRAFIRGAQALAVLCNASIIFKLSRQNPRK